MPRILRVELLNILERLISVFEKQAKSLRLCACFLKLVLTESNVRALIKAMKRCLNFFDKYPLFLSIFGATFGVLMAVLIIIATA